MNRDIQRVAIVRLSALGDIVNSAVVLQFIQEHYPDCKIEWITEEVFAPLLQTLNEIDSVHSVNLKKLKKERSFSLLRDTIKELRALGPYDIVIDMQGLIKSAIVSYLLGKNRHGFDRNSIRESLASLFYSSSSTIAYQESVVRRNAFVVGDALGFSITDKMLDNKEPIFPITQTFSLRSDIKNIAIVIGASWESKIYPKERVAELCNALEEQCYIIWGSEQERHNAEWICEHSRFATLAPKLTLDALVSFVSSVDLLIGNDTGPTHIAWAQNIPSITLFGPTTARMMYETPLNAAIKSPSKVDILKIDKNDFSIKEITPKQIQQKAKELLYNGL